MSNRSRSPWLFGVLVGLLVLAGCGSPPPVADTGPIEVTVSRPVQREVADYDDYTGRVESTETVEVRSRVRGHLVKVDFQDGAEVKEGKLLFEIDPRPFEATLERVKADLVAAEAASTLAKAEYQRIRVLVSKAAASREELDVAIGKRDVAAAAVVKEKAAVEQARLDLSYCRITAPIDGRTSRTAVTVGNLINAGGGETLLTTLVSVEPMYVYFDVDERSLLRYLEADRGPDGKPRNAGHIKELKIPVWLGLANQEGYPRKGVIDFADNQVDPRTGTIRVRAVFSNKDRVLAPGLFARIRIQASDPYKALLITDRAIGTNQGQKYVYVVGKDNKVAERPVKLGQLDGGLRVVREGLGPDDWVVVKGMQRVREGTEVTRKEATMPGAAAEAPPVAVNMKGD
jgi:RND family efflux transporter MFP subunit